MPTERLFSKDHPERFNFYHQVLGELDENKIPYATIGGFGQYFYGNGREPTYDLDVAIEPRQVGHALGVLRKSRRIEHKHPQWLNQVWSAGHLEYPSFSIDLIHRHSTGLTEVKPWWIKQGIKGKVEQLNTTFAAPEAIALTKLLLWSRRSHDVVDAVQVAQGSGKKGKSFDWDLLLDELHSDWRLGYSLALLTEVLYGEAAAETLDQDVKKRLHRSFTHKPIPGPTRGHIFAYDAYPEAGNIETWENATAPIMVAPEFAVENVLNDLYGWHENHKKMIDASRKLMGQGHDFDWQKLIDQSGDNWRLVLVSILNTEVLYGETGSRLIPQEVKNKLSERFLNSSPGRELGTKLFPYRF